MPVRMSYHSSLGGFDFLGLRKSPTGAVEIVYDDGVKRRMIWRVQSKVRDSLIDEALSRAVNQPQVLAAMYSELKRRSISIEAVAV